MSVSLRTFTIVEPLLLSEFDIQTAMTTLLPHGRALRRVETGMDSFTARGVAATTIEDTNCRVVALAEDPNGDGGPVLQIQRSLTHDDQDRRLGFDTYCLSDERGASIYGGVLSYSLEGSTLTMRVNQKTRDVLGIPEEFAIQLDTDDATVESVREALAWILQDVPLLQ